MRTHTARLHQARGEWDTPAAAAAAAAAPPPPDPTVGGPTPGVTAAAYADFKAAVAAEREAGGGVRAALEGAAHTMLLCGGETGAEGENGGV